MTPSPVSRSRTASSIEPLEARIAPAALVGKSSLTYADYDGDTVTVTFSKPLLTDNALASTVFSFSGSGGNIASPVNGDSTTHEYLTKINVSSLGTAADGLGIKVSVKHGSIGDGFATVGLIDATNVNLGTVSIQGDLASIDATQGSAKSAIASLTVQSLGRYGTASGAASVASNITGAVGSLTVKGDDLGAFDVTGTVGKIVIGGSVVGTAANTGTFLINENVSSIKIGGNLQGGTAQPSGQLSLASVGSITIGGSIIGGAASDTGEIDSTGVIGAIKVGHDVIAGTASFTGAIDSNARIGSVVIGGSLVGNSTHSALISAKGTLAPATQTASIAIASITVNGRVENAQILAGYDFSGAAANGDASIGTVTVKGDWVASDLVAGATKGNDGRFGQKNATSGSDDNLIANGINTPVTARIGAIVIGGTILGTSSSTTDSHAFVAERFGTFKLDGVLLTIPQLNQAFSPLTGYDMMLESFVI